MAVTTEARLPRTLDGPWNLTIEQSKESVDDSFTELMHRAFRTQSGGIDECIGNLQWDRPSDKGIVVNRATKDTPRVEVSVRAPGAKKTNPRVNHLPPSMGDPDKPRPLFPIDKSFKATDPNSRDNNLMVVVENHDFPTRAREWFESITWQTPVPFMRWLDPEYKYNRFTKAIRYSEDEPWAKLPFGHQSGQVSGFPMLPLLLDKATLGTHALALTAPPRYFLHPSFGLDAIAPNASSTDGHCGDKSLGYLRMGQHVILRPDFPTAGLGSLARIIVRVLQTYGAYFTMSGDAKGAYGKFVTRSGAFTRADLPLLAGIGPTSVGGGIKGTDWLCVG